MRVPDRKETEVRRLMESVPPVPLPTDLAVRALVRGMRIAQRRRTFAVLLWGFFAVAVGFAVWAAVAEPWAGEPTVTTPPLGW